MQRLRWKTSNNTAWFAIKEKSQIEIGEGNQEGRGRLS